MKKMNYLATYKVETARATYLVTLDRLANTNAGCPRFQANIIKIADNNNVINDNYFVTAVYRFKGHYCSELDEARYIVEHHENEIIKKNMEV